MSDFPHDLEAEESVLGTLLISPSALDLIADRLLSSDFYKPSHALIYSTILDLRNRGTAVDPVTVSNALDHGGNLSDIGDAGTLIGLQMNVPSTANVRHYAEIVISHSLRRRLMVEGRHLSDAASSPQSDVAELLEVHQATLSNLGVTGIDHEPDDVAVEEFVYNQTKDKILPWAVHGIIRKQHKLILVGNEGSGKSWLLRFVAICAAYGIQPFRHTLEKPIRTLIIDAENPIDALYESFEKILSKVTDFNPQAETVNRLWWRPAGINLRNRVDAAQLENVIRARRPDLVCLGPLYAAYENSAKDFGWETSAREVQNVLKRLMVRYDFALMIEDHAPQDRSGGMRPYGSSFWRRWPDIGIGMEAVKGREDKFELKRWRGDRVPTDWPKTIERGSATGSPWPFLGHWGDDEDFYS